MTGIATILHENGLSVTNEAVLDADKHLVIDGDKKYSRDVLTLKLIAIFDVKGTVKGGEQVECLFKTDDGKKYAFIGSVKSIGKQTTVIHELLKSDRYNEILTKIKI